MSAASVTAVDVLDDQQWFHDHPKRRYRLREGWAIRRRGKAFLRVRLPNARAYIDNERLGERIWWMNAWPELDPLTRTNLAKAARPQGGER